MSRRILPITLGYLVSCAVAGTVIALAVDAPYILANFPNTALSLGRTPFVAFAAAIVILIYAALPTLFVVTYAERTGRRSAGFYALAGATSGLVSFAMSRLGQPPIDEPLFGNPATFSYALARLVAWMALLAVAGSLSGLAYWAIAGRRAGAQLHG